MEKELNWTMAMGLNQMYCTPPPLPTPNLSMKKVSDAQHHYIILFDVNWCGPGREWYFIRHKYRWSCDFYLQNLLLIRSLDKNIGHGPSIVTNLLGSYHHLYSCYAPHKIHWNIFLSVHLIISSTHPTISTYICNIMSKYPPLHILSSVI